MADSETVSRADSPAVLIDVDQVAKLLKCSPRHVCRMVEAGKLPRPRQLGSLVRWSLHEIERWVASGCKPIDATGGAK